jgi:hypothetical protein
LQSDDGSRLRIGGRTVVDYDGIHDGRTSRSGRIALAAGCHPMELTYFEAAMDEVLILQYEGPRIPRSPLPASALSHVPASMSK